MQVAYAVAPDQIIMWGGLGPVDQQGFDLFKEHFTKAINECAKEIDQGPVTYQEIMIKQHCFTQSSNHKILKVALQCKCNQPNLGWGSTAFTKTADGQVTYSAILRTLFD